MSYGLNVWDGNGKLTLGLSDSISRLLGTVQTTKGLNGSISADFSKGRPWAQILNTGVTGASVTPQVTISGNTLSWAYTGNASMYVSVVILYGVY
ncbi:hypothetical protein [Pseudomonas massiliensis]|uniref:hypothetical protein n=1 Tax=Pseudomonas massiliensis TaxID=522492 RepID=UPI00058D2760|nr:hypothetical protein [Pseudomonas massiliensis]